MDDVEVVVVGAGPTGLAMAIELARAGVPHRIVDKSLEPARYSQALVLQPRTLEQFDRYGIGQLFVKVGRRLDGVAVYDRRRRIAALRFDGLASRHPYLVLAPQSETERLLGEHLRCLGTEVERGKKLVAVRDTGGAVQVDLQDHGALTERVSARWLVGCDGVHSTVRRAIGIPFVGEEVGQLFQLGDIELRGSERPSDELRIHLQRGELVFIGRLRGDVYRLIVVNYPPDDAPADRAFGLAEFQAALRRCVSDEIDAVSAEWTSSFRVHERRAEHHRRGNVFLAGDACHVHSPVFGQGMNTGIQDAANLGWKLAAVTHCADPSLLDTYDTERGSVGELVVRRTSRARSVAFSGNALLTAARDAALAVGVSIPKLRESAQAFISEIAIRYRDLPAAVDCSHDGALQAGDRMPDLELALESGTRASISTLLRGARPLVLVTDRSASEHDLGAAANARVEHVKAGGDPGPEVTVVRPDGYIGFRGGPQHHAHLQAYARLVGL